MAKVNGDMTKGLSGAVGQQLVFRMRGGKTFASRYPDMSKVKPSEKQLAEKDRFGDAVRFAQGIINDPVKKAAYKVEKRKVSVSYGDQGLFEGELKEGIGCQVLGELRELLAAARRVTIT